MFCIPVGMEQFPASSLSQWDYIKKMIDMSDYYLLIVAGKYGSIDPEENISYTEKEYNYAVNKKMPILALGTRDWIPEQQQSILTIIGDDRKKEYCILGLLNSCVAPYILGAINPTLQLNVGEVLSFPVSQGIVTEKIEGLSDVAISLVKEDWDSFEISWDFEYQPLTIRRNQ